MGLAIRQSARLVILNDRNEVFLLHHQDVWPADPANPVLRRYWVTPGGGVEPGETWEAAALRELWEETGIDGVALGPWVWSREKVTVIIGKPTRGIERYYLVRVGDAVVSNGNQLEYEREIYQEHRWWPVPAIRASIEVFYPEGLAGLLEPIVAGAIPATPIDISPV